jgi:LmbE family N-acetylglucosaminyl deacetylase
VYLTDGRRGSGELAASSLPAAERDRRAAELGERRKAEAAAWASRTGAEPPVFLAEPDGRLRARPEVSARVAALLADTGAELLYVPSVLEAHPDHWEANRVAALALASLGGRASGLTVRGYEVWSPVVANRLVEVTEQMDEKLAALRLYASQLEDRDYVKCVAGLNAYRALALPGGQGFAEGFFEMSGERLADLVERLR